MQFLATSKEQNLVFGTNQLKIAEMMKTGIVLNFCGVLIISLIMYFWGQVVFDIDLSVSPPLG